MLCVRSFDGKNVIRSWHPRAMNAPITKLNNIFFFEQLSMRSIREVRLTSGEQSEVFKTMFVFFLCTIHFLILSIILNWSIESNLTMFQGNL